MGALRVAAFEFRLQLRGHVFWVVFAISCAMVLGSVWVEELRVGLPNEGLRDGAAVVARTHLLWSLFYMFTAAAFVSDAALRDHASGLAPIVEAMPVRRTDLRLGRFAGAFAAVALCFLSVPAALALGALAPWVEPATVGPFHPKTYLFPFAALALPNLFLMSATFFALVTTVRSLAAALLGAAALLVLYGLADEGGGGPRMALLEPFGFAAHARAVAGWTAAARDAGTPALAGELLLNRLLWIGMGGVALAAALTVRPRPARPQRMVPDGSVMPAPAVAQPPRFARGTAVVQFAARARFEVGQVLESPVLVVLLALGIANAAAALWAADTSSTGAVVRALVEAFRLLPTVIVLFFAGELVWNERERRVDALIGAAPVPDAAFLLPKLLALVLLLAALALAGTAAAASVQAVRGQTLDVGALLRLFGLPAAYDWALVAVLALFFQALAPTKVAGWGYMILYLIASLALQRLGYDDPLYRYGRYPGWPLPATLSGAEGVALYRTYWGAFAAGLILLAVGLVGRGANDVLPARLQRLPSRLHAPWGVAATVAFIVFIGLGGLLSGCS